jgi:hypothetical protein
MTPFTDALGLILCVFAVAFIVAGLSGLVSYALERDTPGPTRPQSGKNTYLEED